MKARAFRVVGFISLVIGLILVINSLSSITGFTIIENIGRSTSSILGIILVIGGVVLLSAAPALESTLEQKVGVDRKTAKIRREIDQTLRSGSVGTYRDLRHIANKLGYNLVEDGPHTKVYHGNHLVTAIPRHTGDAPRGTYRSILRSLYDESERVA